MTPDPYRATTGSVNNPADPGSWNRYAYVLGDPINFHDPRDLVACEDWQPGDPGEDCSANEGVPIRKV